MIINFSGETPEKNQVSLSVMGNNNVDHVEFVFDRFLPDGQDLLEYKPYVKVQSPFNLYADKDIPEEFGEYGTGKVWVQWYLLDKATKFRTLFVQVQFESKDEKEVIWQSEIVTLLLRGTINADEQIAHRQRSQLQDHEKRITAAENALDGKVDKTTKINGYGLFDDVNLSADDLDLIAMTAEDVEIMFNK